MITLFQLPRVFGTLNVSPPCLKLETWLRLMKIPHELGVPDPRKAPKGKMPFIDDDGTLIGDSNLVIDHLAAKLGRSLDDHLSPGERAASLAFRRMLDENFYWVIIETRWKKDDTFARMEEELVAKLASGAPPMVLRSIAESARAELMKQQHGQGIGRHTREEILAIGRKDLEAVRDWLGDKPWFMGDRPSTVDATVFANLVSILDVPIENELRTWTLGCENLVAYRDRVRDAVFPDHRELIASS